MEDRRKRSSGNGDEEERESSPAVKRPRENEAAAEEDDVGEDIMAWLSLEEDEEEDDRLILELLEAEKSCAAAEANKVRFTENPYHRSSPASVFQTMPSSYVTINGNEESCGSSFSDWDSSVMASVDMAGFGAAAAAGSELFGFGFGFGAVDSGFTAEMGGAWGSHADEGCGGAWEGLGLDLDDDSLAGFLGGIFSEQSVAQ